MVVDLERKSTRCPDRICLSCYLKRGTGLRKTWCFFWSANDSLLATCDWTAFSPTHVPLKWSEVLEHLPTCLCSLEPSEWSWCQLNDALGWRRTLSLLLPPRTTGTSKVWLMLLVKGSLRRQITKADFLQVNKRMPFFSVSECILCSTKRISYKKWLWNCNFYKMQFHRRFWSMQKWFMNQRCQNPTILEHSSMWMRKILLIYHLAMRRLRHKSCYVGV